MTILELYTANYDWSNNKPFEVYAYNEGAALFSGTWDTFPMNFDSLEVDKFYTSDNGKLFIELKPGEENK